MVNCPFLLQILNGVSFKAQKGQTVAVVGASGAGKSTCVELIQRFYDPTRGQIMIDSHDLRELNLKWVRSQIGVVGQEPVLFGGSIRDNILLGNEDANDHQIEYALRSANALDFIRRLPKVINHLGLRRKGVCK